MFSIFAVNLINSANDEGCPLNVPLKLFTFCPRKWISEVPLSASAETSSRISSQVLETSWPLVLGTTQNEQYLLQPSTIETNAEGAPCSGAVKWLNFSSLGKDISVWDFLYF